MSYKIIKKQLLALMLGVVVGASMFLFGLNTNLSNSPNEAEIGFAQDMSVHHQQAIEMSFLVRERTDRQDIRGFAFDIINTQANQRGMMLGWLDLWEKPLTTTKKPMMWMADSMSSMNHSQMNDSFTSGAYMPGMATKAEVDQLVTLEDKAAEKLFLELMIRHHQGGVMMAEGVIERSDNETVTRLAQTMVNGQQAEIDYMNELLEEY
ncbi:MAG TPA: DUF305 domain-containing protein [Candidatus Paceibacterota bacterium]|mgnify:FL=1|nr:DUF305 domain-containing protein [Candidatus Paceibacterota bacterium]HMO82560.1 DUF305 domain-containing protein [Candidatus Paceibacterota bacterium]